MLYGMGQKWLRRIIVDQYLDKLFYNIRFGVMEIEEFRNLSKKYPTVLAKDFQTITKLIVLPQDQQDKFNAQPRLNGPFQMVLL